MYNRQPAANEPNIERRFGIMYYDLMGLALDGAARQLSGPAYQTLYPAYGGNNPDDPQDPLPNPMLAAVVGHGTLTDTKQNRTLQLHQNSRPLITFQDHPTDATVYYPEAISIELSSSGEAVAEPFTRHMPTGVISRIKWLETRNMSEQQKKYICELWLGRTACLASDEDPMTRYLKDSALIMLIHTFQRFNKTSNGRPIAIGMLPGEYFLPSSVVSQPHHLATAHEEPTWDI